MEVFNPQKIEKEILSFWKSQNIYKKVKLSRKGRKVFYFADGPPYATGSIHMGTAQNKIIKDVYIRLWRMKGFDVWDQPGYDTHGLPIEYQVEKELGFTSKKDIESYGSGKFIAKCRKFATRFIDVMSDQFNNLGVWMDWKNPYTTLQNQYIEATWHTFKKAREGGFLYNDKYPVHVCPRCETAVSYNEIVYKKLPDPSIFVKLPLKGKKREYLLVWTTTPWTLPANTGVMANPSFEYSYIKTEYGDTLLIATELVDKVMETSGVEAYHTVKKVKGKSLAGLRYTHPLEDLTPCLQNLKKAHRVVIDKRHVTLDEGTGLVHTAPGHGLEDYQVGKREGLPFLSPVNPDGTFSKEAGSWLEGKFTKSADPIIIEKLSERNCILKALSIVHDYPTCWRCSNSLLQISVPQWFFRITAIQDRIIKENKKVNWVPKWAGERFSDWLQNLGDWPVSRQRYWGIPLPIWECDNGHIEVIGSYQELKKKSRLSREIDFHRPEIDKITLKCPECRKPMKRTPDVLDVWFDAGVSTWAALGYPRKKALFEKMWPCDFQTEGPDQIRGWWNSQMITSMLTFGRAPYKNILFHGLVMDAKGVKMSKSLGNVIDPMEISEKYSRDVLRFYLLESAAWDDFYVSLDNLKETYKIFSVFWNVYQFIQTYAPKPITKKPVLNIEDKWIISRLNSLIQKSSAAFEYRIHTLVQELDNFILNDFSRWYIKLVRNRVSPWYEGKDKSSAQWTLRHVLETTLKTLAPISPFITEKIYQDMFPSRVSVHAEDWPKPDPKKISKTLEKEMFLIQEMIEAISFARQDNKIKLKWPLSVVYIKPKDQTVERALRRFSDVIKLMANTKEIKTLKKSSGNMKDFSGGRLSIGDILKDEVLVRELIRTVQVLRKKEGLDVQSRIKTWIKSDKETLSLLKNFEQEILSGTGSSELNLGEVENQKGQLKFSGKTLTIGFRK
jgi:isoleucyl-tRNA synthetase